MIMRNSFGRRETEKVFIDRRSRTERKNSERKPSISSAFRRVYFGNDIHRTFYLTFYEILCDSLAFVSMALPFLAFFKIFCDSLGFLKIP